MSRYAYNRLKDDVEGLNSQLEERGHGYRFQIGGRNGYTAIDLARLDQLKGRTSERNLVCGSPRECLAACQEYLDLHVSLDTLAE